MNETNGPDEVKPSRRDALIMGGGVALAVAGSGWIYASERRKARDQAERSQQLRNAIGRDQRAAEESAKALRERGERLRENAQRARDGLPLIPHLTKCRLCKTEISNQARTCPSCGHPQR